MGADNVAPQPAPSPSRWERFKAGALAVVKSPWFVPLALPVIAMLAGAACHALPAGRAQDTCETVVDLSVKGLKVLSGGSGGGAAAGTPAVSALDAGT